jgi:SAM-dependent methyltransferase
MSDKYGTSALELFDLSTHHDWFYQIIKCHIGNRLLEVGAGRGHLTDCYLEQPDNIWLTEFDPQCLEHLAAKYNGNKKIQVEFLDLTTPPTEPYLSARFDTILSSNVIEHLESDEEALAWMCNILKPGGKLILILPAHRFLFGAIDKYYQHYRRYDRSSLCHKLEQNKLVVKECFYQGKVGALGWFLKSCVFRQKKITPMDVTLQNILFPFSKIIEKTIKLPFGQSLITVAEKT